MIEIIIGFSLLVSGAIGYKIADTHVEELTQQVEQEKSASKPLPMYWGADKHKDYMMICSEACDGKLLKYSPISGKCECKSEGK